MTRLCRKCKAPIPNRYRINGKEHVLNSRKFCLRCSPFRSGNTSPNDPIIRKARKWKHYTDEQKARIKLCLYRRGLKLRRELYTLSGGSCKICGYHKCDRALSFHHRDRSTKEFGLTLNNLWSKSRCRILAEWRKCDLLCMNCHTEVEDAIARKTSIVQLVNSTYATDY